MAEEEKVEEEEEEEEDNMMWLWKTTKWVPRNACIRLPWTSATNFWHGQLVVVPVYYSFTYSPINLLSYTRPKNVSNTM